MKLIVQADLTLDGVMQSPGLPDEDRSGGFDHGGWLVPFADELFQEARRDLIRAAEGLLLGRKTYEIFAGYWPRITDPDNEIATNTDTTPTTVVTSVATKAADHSPDAGACPRSVSEWKISTARQVSTKK